MLLACLAILASPLLGIESVAHADVLVSNMGKAEDGGANSSSSNPGNAQKFTVESSRDYTLTDVVINVRTNGTSGLTVAIHEVDGSNPASSSLYTLTPPASPGTGQQTYTAPANAVLEKGESYFVVIRRVGGGTNSSIGYTSSDGEDAGGVSGWSIADNRHRIVGGVWATASSSLRITINGQANEAETPITASLTALDPVEGADGRRRHSFDLKLSEPVIKSFRKMRNSVFTVTNGTVAKARHIHRERRYDSDAGRFRTYSNHWRLEVRPTNLSSAVTVAMTASQACTEAGALCTPDGGWLDFSVSLSRAYTEYVCFDFETLTTGTATEGTDYGKRPKVLDWVRPGKTSTTAFVRIVDDHVSDSGETVKVRISNARLCNDASMTVTINRAEATGTITNSGQMPQAWLARFGRTVADQVIDAVDGRLGAAHRPGVEATLAGQGIAGAPEADGTRQSMAQDTASRMRLEAVTSWLRGDTLESRAGLSGSQAVSERDLLAGTAFSMTGKTEGGGLVALWGRGASTSFDGREAVSRWMARSRTSCWAPTGRAAR